MVDILAKKNLLSILQNITSKITKNGEFQIFSDNSNTDSAVMGSTDAKI